MGMNVYVLEKAASNQSELLTCFFFLPCGNFCKLGDRIVFLRMHGKNFVRIMFF